jgi:hypothetical protein
MRVCHNDLAIDVPDSSFGNSGKISAIYSKKTAMRLLIVHKPKALHYWRAFYFSALNRFCAQLASNR